MFSTPSVSQEPTSLEDNNPMVTLHEASHVLPQESGFLRRALGVQPPRLSNQLGMALPF